MPCHNQGLHWNNINHMEEEHALSLKFYLSFSIKFYKLVTLSINVFDNNINNIKSTKALF